MTEVSNVLDCPFCGHEAKLCPNDMGDGYEVNCFGCMARGPSEKTADKAGNTWNRVASTADYTMSGDDLMSVFSGVRKSLAESGNTITDPAALLRLIRPTDD